jgi:hypothetical protein
MTEAMIPLVLGLLRGRRGNIPPTSENSLPSNVAEKPFGISKSNWPSFSSPRVRRRRGQLLLFALLVCVQTFLHISCPLAKARS